jgi:hypothetical protein
VLAVLHYLLALVEVGAGTISLRGAVSDGKHKIQSSAVGGEIGVNHLIQRRPEATTLHRRRRVEHRKTDESRDPWRAGISDIEW